MNGPCRWLEDSEADKRVKMLAACPQGDKLLALLPQVNALGGVSPGVVMMGLFRGGTLGRSSDNWGHTPKGPAGSPPELWAR